MTISGRDVGGVLLLYHRPTALWRSDASTVNEHVESFARYSRYPVWTVNTQMGAPRRLSGLRFGAVILHYSLFATSGYLLDDRLREYLGTIAADSYKIAFFQDEFHYCRQRFAFLNEYSIDCVYSCLEPEYLERVYGAYTSVPTLKSNVPGYVSDDLIATADRFRVDDERRRVDIGYRGRTLPAYVGRGGLEKAEIGDRFLEHAAGTDLTLDIAKGEGDRIYGDDWYRFIAGCRAFLGTESGTSVFDPEDEVLAQWNELSADGHEPTIEELERGALGSWDGWVPYRTVSPRHFEAAALGVCQILYEGKYSQMMEPMVDYIPLRKDFSNFDEVVERFREPGLRCEIAANARRRMIDSGQYHYREFIAGVDRALAAAGVEVPSQRDRGADRLLGRGRAGRLLRSHAWDVFDELSAREFRGKRQLRAVGRPAARRLRRMR